jgi:cardiolipin synthase
VTAKPPPNPQWLCGGGKFYPAMLAAIAQARQSINLEIYIFADDTIGGQFLAALTRAAETGVRVRVLADAYGSLTLSEKFFTPLIQAGGEFRFFNPLRFSRFGVRDHRKLLICDRQTAFLGGANICDYHSGDGITQGWFDLMIRITGAEFAGLLAEEFEQTFANASFAHGRFRRLRAFRHFRRRTEDAQILAVRPGRGASSFQRALHQELARAQSADFIVPYFLPSRRLRKLLRQIVQRGGRVRLILPAHCDVPLARAAGLIYYARLLRSGVELYEYQPQILHAKLCIVDEKVFAGSSNLDVRSFNLNYELMLRFTDAATVAGAKEIFAEALQHSRRIEQKAFRQSQNFWQRWKNYWAHFLVARVDPLVGLRQIGPNRPQVGD